MSIAPPQPPPEQAPPQQPPPPPPATVPVAPVAAYVVARDNESNFIHDWLLMLARLRRRFGIDFLDILRRNPLDPAVQDQAIAVAEALDEAFHVAHHLAVMAESGLGEVEGFVPKDAVAWAQNYAAQRVVEVSKSVEETVRTLIVAGLQRGDSVDQVASEIRSTVGLHRAWATAVGRYYRNLVAKGTPLGRAAEMRDAYARRLIARRAETIARTEFVSASANGRLEGYRRMQRNGSLGADVEKEWLTAKSEVSKRGRRVCAICKPLNHRRVRGLDGVFTSGKFSAVIPGIHVNCRCSFRVVTAGSREEVSPEVPTTPTERIAAVVAPRALIEMSGQPEERDAFARAVEDFAADYPAAASQITFIKPYRKEGTLAEVVVGKAVMPQASGWAKEPYYSPQGLGIYFNPSVMRQAAHQYAALSVQAQPGPQRWYDTITHELGHVLQADWHRRESALYARPFSAIGRFQAEMFITDLVNHTPALEPLWARAVHAGSPGPYGEQNRAEFFAEIFLATRRYRNVMSIPEDWDALISAIGTAVEGVAKAVEKALSAADRKSFEAETERIKANREGPGAKPHKFVEAHWTHPNGHPRCLLCGEEQSLPENFTGDLTKIPVEEWPIADCKGYRVTKATDDEWPVNSEGDRAITLIVDRYDGRVDVAKVRHVRTPAGVEFFHLPIGSPIVGHHHLPSSGGMKGQRVIGSWADVRDLMKGGDVFVRYSGGPELDAKMGGRSRDQQSGEVHAGLSAVRLDPDDEELAVKQLVEYHWPGYQIRDTGVERKPYLFHGDVVGTDSDGGPVVKVGELLGVPSEDLLRRATAFSRAQDYIVGQMKLGRGSEWAYYKSPPLSDYMEGPLPAFPPKPTTPVPYYAASIASGRLRWDGNKWVNVADLEPKPGATRVQVLRGPVQKHLPGLHDQRSHGHRNPATVVARMAGLLGHGSKGFTMHPLSGKLETSGYAVSKPGSRFFTPTFFRDHPDEAQRQMFEYLKAVRADHQRNPTIRAGVWRDTDPDINRDEFVFDHTVLLPDKARNRRRVQRLGRRWNQQVVVHLDDMEFIPTGGTGR